jgi:diacylglycerol kinase family enzyme
MMASTRAFFSVVNNAPSFQAEVVTPEGVRRHVTAGISVSNNPLEGALPHAVRLDRGLLGIYVIAPLTPMFLLKLSGAALRGGWKALPEITDLEIPNVTIRFPRAKKDSVAVLDGELVKLDREVEFAIHPGALKAVVPMRAHESGPNGTGAATAPA